MSTNRVFPNRKISDKIGCFTFLTAPVLFCTVLNLTELLLPSWGISVYMGQDIDWDWSSFLPGRKHKKHWTLAANTSGANQCKTLKKKKIKIKRKKSETAQTIAYSSHFQSILAISSQCQPFLLFFPFILS